MRRAAAYALAALGLIGQSGAACAQNPAAAITEEFEPETIQIGLSTDKVSLTAGFSGADLTIFGSVDNADPGQTRRRGYDVVVVLEGPADPVVVREKTRVLGMWINTRHETFVNVPMSYSIATTRPLQDITDPQNYKRLSLGIDTLYLQPKNPATNKDIVVEYGEALRQQKKANNLYSANYGGVVFLSQSLFRATLRLAPDVPVGTHRARAFLFKNGEFVQETSASLDIRKSGFEQSVYNYAHQQSMLYGLFSIALAMLIGWLGRLVFRKD